MAEDRGREHKPRLTGCLLAALVGLEGLASWLPGFC